MDDLEWRLGGHKWVPCHKWHIIMAFSTNHRDSCDSNPSGFVPIIWIQDPELPSTQLTILVFLRIFRWPMSYYFMLLVIDAKKCKNIYIKEKYGAVILSILVHLMVKPHCLLVVPMKYYHLFRWLTSHEKQKNHELCSMFFFYKICLEANSMSRKSLYHPHHDFFIMFHDFHNGWFWISDLVVPQFSSIPRYR